MTRVLIAARSAVVRAGLATLLDGLVEVVGQADFEHVVPQVEAVRPDVVLVDLERGETLPPGPTFSREAGPPALVILAAEPDLQAALAQGAHAVLPGDAVPPEIAAAVGAAAAGLVAFRPEVLQELAQFGVRVAAPLEGEPLTAREHEVLAMLAEGAGNKQIARALGISEHTVKFHVGSILAKLNAATRTEAVTIGVRQGLILL